MNKLQINENVYNDKIFFQLKFKKPFFQFTLGEVNNYVLAGAEIPVLTILSVRYNSWSKTSFAQITGIAEVKEGTS